MHQGEASEAVVRVLFRENPAGAKEKDKVRAAAGRFCLTLHVISSVAYTASLCSRGRVKSCPLIWPWKLEVLFLCSLCCSQRALGVKSSTSQNLR